MMNMKQHILILTTVCILSTPALAGSITFRSDIQVKQDTKDVLLKDIALLTGDDATKWSTLKITELQPNIPITRLSRHKIITALKTKPLNWGTMTVGGARTVNIHRTDTTKAPASKPTTDNKPSTQKPTTSVTSDNTPTVRSAITSLLVSTLRADERDLKITYENEQDPVLALSGLKHRFEIDVPARQYLGQIQVVVRVYDLKGQSYKAHRLALVVKQRTTVFVLKRTVQRGETISLKDVRHEELWIDSETRQPCKDYHDLHGKEANTRLRAGEIVYQTSVSLPEVVKSGDIMTVRVIRGGIILRARVKALESGVVGETIRTRKPDSRETLYVKITGTREGILEEALTQVSNASSTSTNRKGR